MAVYTAISVWGYCFICYKGTPRPDNEIRQDTILTPFLCSIANASLEDAKQLVRSMKTKIAFFLTFLFNVILLYAGSPNTFTNSDNNLYISLDWNKPTPDLSKRLYDNLIKAKSDSTNLFLSFYENGLYDKYGNQFVFMSDTIKVQTFHTAEIQRFKNYHYFNNIFNIVDTIMIIRDRFTHGVDFDRIDSIAKIEADKILLTEQELRNRVDSLQLQFNTFYDTNPFDPLDKNHLHSQYIERPNYGESLYFLITLKKLMSERFFYSAILELKFPSNEAPPLAEDDDE